jgi:hypothetical protein
MTKVGQESRAPQKVIRGHHAPGSAAHGGRISANVPVVNAHESILERS